jgi:hypothetical protein
MNVAKNQWCVVELELTQKDENTLNDVEFSKFSASNIQQKLICAKVLSHAGQVLVCLKHNSPRHAQDVTDACTHFAV